MGYKSMWEWLGIAPTTDLIAIKRAFAEKSKEYHPEEHPEEFQALQKAYHAAAAYARANKKQSGDSPISGKNTADSGTNPYMELVIMDAKEPENTKESERAKEPENTKESERAKEPEEIKMEGEFSYDDIADAFRQDQFESFLSEFSAIMYHSKLRNNIFCWKFFLGQEKYQNYLKEAATWNRIIELVKTVNRWRRDTILYFEECRDRNLGNTTAKGDIPKFPKAVKRFRTKKYCGQCTPKELELHRYLLKQIHCQDAGLKRFENIAAYLELYLPYAAAQPGEVYDFYDSIKVKGHVGVVLLEGLGILSIWIGLILNAAGFFDSAGKIPENEYMQERMDNLKKNVRVIDSETQYHYEQYQERIDEIMDEVHARYDTWEQDMEESEAEREMTENTEL